MFFRTNISLLFAFFSLQISLSQSTITFVNTGKMHIGLQQSGSGVSLYIPDDIRHLSVAGSDVKVIQTGKMELGGSFYHDATTNIFEVDSDTKTTSTGIIGFVGEHTAKKREITTWNENIIGFDRGGRYIAFPNILIGTNDSIFLAAKMGIDANSINRTTTKTGYFILKSEEINSQVYNASLRLPFSGSSESLVSNGAVLVEQYVKTYRTGTQLFAFASPFKNTQLSGYFAGNWVRKPTNDGLYGHTTYVLGNKPSTTNPTIIDADQYVYYPETKLECGRAYLIKPRPTGYDYNLLRSTSGLLTTGATVSAYDKDRFVFDGNVYTLPSYNEQIFAEDLLFQSPVIPANTTISNTINWLIGNSYTSPVSTELLANKLINSPLRFQSTIYVFPAGSTSYQPCNITNSGDAVIVSDITEIPSMSIFMVRVSKGQTTPNYDCSLTLGKEILRHGNASHSNPKYIKSKSNTLYDQVRFKLSPDVNPNIYDLAAIGIRSKALLGSDDYDIAKVYNGGNEGFQLFSLSETNSKLSANAVPPTVEKVKLCIKPPLESAMYRLDVAGTETLSTEGIWLQDLFTGQVIDLKLQSQYCFVSKNSDPAERFIVHFKKPVNTNMETLTALSTIYFDGKLSVINLNQQDCGSVVSVHNMQGGLIKQTTICSYPVQQFELEATPGIYIVSVKGARSTTSKILYK